MSQSDAELIQNCLTGNQAAWFALVDRYSGLVYSIARKSGLRPDECDDVAQVVFAILFRRLATIRDAESLAGWLGTTTRREAWRAKRRSAPALATASIENVELAISDMNLERAIRQARIRTAVELLDGRCRELLTALYLTEATPEYEQIAANLGLAVGSIGPIRRRCLGRLIDILHDAEHDSAA